MIPLLSLVNNNFHCLKTIVTLGDVLLCEFDNHDESKLHLMKIN
jgi:hypothetical protein